VERGDAGAVAGSSRLEPLKRRGRQVQVEAARQDRVAAFDNRLSLGRGRLHLTFTLGNKRIAYAYIRKNGCSAFKRALGYDPAVDVEVVAAGHAYRRGRHDATIFVWRDPLDRMVSLYKNKILERRNADYLLAAYREAMGEEPSSFERFTEFACMEKDPHCWRQRDHLMRLRYTHAIPLHRLHEAMCSIVGPQAAEPFAVKANATGEQSVEVTARAAALIRRHYARDYDMIRRING
jgi:hypothetical protein